MISILLLSIVLSGTVHNKPVWNHVQWRYAYSGRMGVNDEYLGYYVQFVAPAGKECQGSDSSGTGYKSRQEFHENGHAAYVEEGCEWAARGMGDEPEIRKALSLRVGVYP